MVNRFSLIVLPLFLLSACVKEEVPVLPEGPQTVRGILQPAEISLLRRGSHLLVVDGVDHAYVESSVVNLRTYERQMVSVSGTYELNAEPTMLPVLVVTEVFDVEETMKQWLLPALSLTLETPNTWQRASGAGKINFHLPDKDDPVVTLYKIAVPENEEDIPEGVSIVIDGKPAVRQTYEGSGTQVVYVLLADNILVLEFYPGVIPEQDSLRTEWLNLLSSVQFDTKTVSPPPVTGTGGVRGERCGGPAGILCPEGSYCEVTNVEFDVGVCRPL